jgi:hypothetical protein
MSLLHWLFPSLFGIRLARPDDDPEVRRLRDCQNKGDVAAVETFLRSVSAPADREFYVEELTTWPGRPKFFDQWVKAAPDSADAWLLRGSHGIKWAWEARTGGRAEDVDQNAWQVFFARLKGAWSDLERAADLNPADATPYGQMVRCAVGLQLPLDQVLPCLAAARERAPEPWEAHLRMLYYLCEKWHGSHEQMLDFARKTSGEAFDGSGLPTLIAVAHTERWLYAKHFDQDKERAADYWDSPQVRTEILDAYRKSLGSRKYRPGRTSRWHRNFFAFALGKIKAQPEAAVEFEQIGNRPMEWPWHSFGDPARVFVSVRDKALA